MTMDSDRVFKLLKNVLPEKKGPCEYCTCPEKYIGVSAYLDTRLYIGLSGRHLRIFDEEYPGYTDCLPVNFCPMCGRKLAD